jgi:hypothetical protein
MFQSWTLYLVDPALTSILSRSSRAEHFNWLILLGQVSPADVSLYLDDPTPASIPGSQLRESKIHDFLNHRGLVKRKTLERVKNP